MTDNNDRNRQRESEIRSEVSHLIEVHPVELGMSLRKLDEVHRERKQIIQQRFSDPEDVKCANKLLKGYEMEEEKERRESDFRKTPREKLWLPSQHDNVLSGFLPIPPMKAHGGTSEVWICKSRFADRTVVVKLLTSQGGIANLQPALALRELQTLFNLRHPNIVNVYDAGYLQTDDGEFPYVAMEEVPGRTLTTWAMQTNHSHDTKVAAVAVSVIASAIQFCHDSGITHGDLKPDNILVDGEMPTKDTITLIDFGFAGSVEASPLGATEGYAAPNAAGTHHLSMIYRDVFSLGGILYFLCIGKHPLSSIGLTHSKWNEWHSSINLGDADLTEICKRCLQYEQADRYSSAKHLDEDLSAWITGHPLPHVRKHAYTWWEKEKLLWKRSRERNDVADHSQVIARASLLLASVLPAVGVGHVLQVATGIDPAMSYVFVLTLINIFSLCLFLTCGYYVRFNVASMKILEPLIALVLSCFCLIHFTSDERYLSLPNWQELNVSAITVCLLLGVLQIAFASLSPEWSVIRPLGWSMIVMAFFLRPLVESRYGNVAMPIVLSVSETVACLFFASRLVIRPTSRLNRQ